MPLDGLGCTCATLTITESLLDWEVWVIFSILSYLESVFAIIHRERGIPSKCSSQHCADCVPALCTHRPSLQPIGWFGKFCGHLCLSKTFMEAVWATLSRGWRSRNTVSVGEPADGSLNSKINFELTLIYWCAISIFTIVCDGWFGFCFDEGRVKLRNVVWLVILWLLNLWTL